MELVCDIVASGSYFYEPRHDCSERERFRSIKEVVISTTSPPSLGLPGAVVEPRKSVRHSLQMDKRDQCRRRKQGTNKHSSIDIERSLFHFLKEIKPTDLTRLQQRIYHANPSNHNKASAQSRSNSLIQLTHSFIDNALQQRATSHKKHSPSAMHQPRHNQHHNSAASRKPPCASDTHNRSRRMPSTSKAHRAIHRRAAPTIRNSQTPISSDPAEHPRR